MKMGHNGPLWSFRITPKKHIWSHYNSLDPTTDQYKGLMYSWSKPLIRSKTGMGYVATLGLVQRRSQGCSQHPPGSLCKIILEGPTDDRLLLGYFSKLTRACGKCVLVGGWALPLWKIWVRQLGWWHSQYMESHKIHVPNHQPASIVGSCYEPTLSLFGVPSSPGESVNPTMFGLNVVACTWTIPLSKWFACKTYRD
jgi:hypothetical protein